MATGWKFLLSKHDSLVKKSNVTLYERVKLLTAVYNDAQYKKAMASSGKSPIELLDCRLKDTCANFTELYQTLLKFPEKGQWEDGDLVTMRQQTIDALRHKAMRARGTPENKKTRKSVVRQTATLHQVAGLETENDRLKRELQTANKLIEILQGQLEQSKETIGSLNEAISLLKLKSQKPAAAKARS